MSKLIFNRTGSGKEQIIKLSDKTVTINRSNNKLIEFGLLQCWELNAGPYT